MRFRVKATDNLKTDRGITRTLCRRRATEGNTRLAKFTQHDELRAMLLGTGEAKLVEHTADDAHWGDGGDGTGKNMLGRILMEVREKLRAEDGAEAGER